MRTHSAHQDFCNLEIWFLFVTFFFFTFFFVGRFGFFGLHFYAIRKRFNFFLNNKLPPMWNDTQKRITWAIFPSVDPTFFDSIIVLPCKFRRVELNNWFSLVWFASLRFNFGVSLVVVCVCVFFLYFVSNESTTFCSVYKWLGAIYN